LEKRLSLLSSNSLGGKLAVLIPAPGPGTKSKATFRWRPFQSALSGSLFFIPPALPEVMIFATGKDSGGR
jgi:hypothetical protein